MARTRLQTGGIRKQKYDYGTLRLKGQNDKIPVPDLRSPRKISSPRPTLGKKNPIRIGGSRKLSEQRPRTREKPEPLLKEDIREADVGFWPSVTIGENESSTRYEFA